ncbi:sodium channel protein Nach-like isoform X2 [Zerene cesonia]|uniref:sodium channel protein Nach-like isoform X2 n=1 Tax=Zerene cesonia TaxID=33412 RepID=UPI0018E562D5|nr:sodium channel protein Nach-like isoform X2 [Zerene cesonia]
MSTRLLEQAQFHGAKRLVYPRHRKFWIFTHILIFCCSTGVVWETVTRYLSNPTYMVQMTAVKTWVTFPTVVVCPEINVPQEKILQFLGRIKYPPGVDATYVESIIWQLGAFYSRDVTFETADLESIQRILEFNDMDVETAGAMLTSTCEEILIKCKWRGKNITCSSLFRMEMTSYGFCCVFNGRSLKREMKNPGYNKKQAVQKLHVSQVGPNRGLIVAISQNDTRPPINTDLYYKWISLKNNGFYYVEMLSNGTPVPIASEIWAGFSTKGIHIADEVRYLSRDLRRCRMTDEPLKYFPEYHRTYCLMECEMARIMERCNCTQLQHPVLPGVRQCGARDIQCVRSSVVPFGAGVCNCPMTCDRDIQISMPSSFRIYPNLPTIDSFYTTRRSIQHVLWLQYIDDIGDSNTSLACCRLGAGKLRFTTD